MCLICKKKQELLAKTGSWFHGKTGQEPNTVREIEAELSTPIHSPSIKKDKLLDSRSEKLSLSPIAFKRNQPGYDPTRVSRPTGFSGESSPEITKPILIRAKSLESCDVSPSRKGRKDYKSDNSDCSSVSVDSQSRKKTVTFGKNDVIQTRIEYIESMDRNTIVTADTTRRDGTQHIEVSYILSNAIPM